MKRFISRTKEEAVETEFLVDTGAFYTILPLDLAEKLRPLMEVELMLADKRARDGIKPEARAMK